MWFSGMVFAGLSGVDAHPEDLVIGRTSGLVFASEAMGRELLGTRDEFLAALSPFDRAARAKSGEPVSEEQFVQFVQRNLRAWDADEQERIGAAIKSIAALLARWPLSFPKQVILVKTTGHEEGQAAYTRQNAIILPEEKLGDRPAALEDLLLHELFHVLSRHDPRLRAALYRTIGFSRIHDVVYPLELRGRKITNPDGVQFGWAISVTNRNTAVSVVPVLYSKEDRYDPSRGGEFFDYLQFKLMVVERADGRWQPALAGGKPQLLDPGAASGFLDQLGRNTDYIIHPDEVLAVNFVFLVRGKKNLPAPVIVAEMDKVLRARSD